MPNRVDSLSQAERVELYRKRAARMMRLAETCESEGVRLTYLKLAAHWQDLILDLERMTSPPGDEARESDCRPDDRG